jgi:protein phosphatase
MGGHAAGERASTLALDTLSAYALNSLPWFFRLEQDSDEEFVLELRAAMEKCEQTIKTESNAISGREGMGTTLTLAYVIWPRVYVIHAGDSRCYLIRDSKLWQVT